MSTLALNKPRIPAIAVSLGTTVLAAFALILANKLVGAAGRSAGLKDACWQLTAVRATLAALTIVPLITFRRDHLALLGLIYGTSLALTHGGANGFYFATAAGFAATAVRWGTACPTDGEVSGSNGASRFASTVLPTLTFIALTAIPSLLSKSHASGLATALKDWTPNLGLRLLSAAVAAVALTFLLPRGQPR